MTDREHSGYRAIRGGEVIASAWCEDCPEATCECLLTVMEKAKKQARMRAGAAIRVVGPRGEELNRLEKVK